MKKFIKTLFIFIIALAVLCGCAGELSGSKYESEWDRDLEEHWKTDENGEKTELGKHEFDDYDVCYTCGCQIYDWGDGRFSVNNFDKNGNILRSTSYEANGDTFEYFVDYDENGNRISSKNYENGELSMEEKYTTASNGKVIPTYYVLYYPNGEKYEWIYDSKGNQIPLSQTFFNEEGNKMEYKYNEYGQRIEKKCYSTEGEILSESYNEYSLAEDGTFYLSFTSYSDYEAIRIFEYTYNELGDWTSYTVYRLDTHSFVSGKTYEYEYDEEGRKIYKKTIENGDLREEFFYDFYEDAEGLQSYCSKYIFYIIEQFTKGHYCITTYDKSGNVLSEVSYDSLGNVIG